MLDEVLDHRLKAGQVALQQGLDNFVVKVYRRFRHRDHLDAKSGVRMLLNQAMQ